MLSKSKIFLYACLSLSLGLGLSQYIPLTIILALGIGVVMVFTLAGRIKAFSFFGIMLLLGLYYPKYSQPPDLSVYVGKKHEWTVLIANDPEVSDKSIKAKAKVLKIDNQAVSTDILIAFSKFPSFDYGDQFLLEGKLEPKSEFNKKENVSGEMVFPKVIRREPGKTNFIKKQIYKTKHLLLTKIEELLPSPASGLLAGLLLGVRSMPKDLNDKFRITGTTHIVAVSGFNVTIIAQAIEKILRRYGRSFSFFGSILAITAFVVLTGATASVVRAGIMGSLVLVAQQVGRLYLSLNALVFASALMLLQNPLLLQFDIGFQLSFAAMAGLLFVQPKLEQFSENSFIKNYIFPTLSAQATTTPIILYHFGNLSIIALLSNLFVLPFVAVNMFVGFFSLVIYIGLGVWPEVIGSISWLLLTYVIKVVELCALIPGASFSELPFPLWAVAIYFFALIYFLKWKPKPKILSNT
jgi:competence protein ComEC